MDAADNDPKTRTGSGTRITDRLAAVSLRDKLAMARET
jgi:hypothetical protein